MDVRAGMSQDRSVAAPQKRISIEELLLRHRAVSEAQLDRAREEQRRSGGDLGRILVSLGYVSEDLLLRAQAHQLGIPLVDPVKNPPSQSFAQLIPLQVVERLRVIAVGGNLESRLLRVATSAPNDTAAVTELTRATGCKIELAVATARSIEAAIRAAYHHEKELPPQPEPELTELQDLRKRIERAERQLSSREYAAALARIERLEQIAENDHHALNVIGQVLLEVGAISREELKRRLSRS
jgi:type II secretion system (T2SS) protein E